MKIAWLLSTVPDLLPKEYSSNQAQSSALRWVGIFKKKNEKRTEIIRHYLTFDKNLCAARLGQVHKVHKKRYCL